MTDRFAGLRIPDLAGIRMLVVGGSIGIGAALAKALGRQGAHVAIHYHRNGEAAERVRTSIEDTGGTAITLSGDVTGRGVAARLVAEAADTLGGLDLLVNNAGALIERRLFAEVDDDLIDATFDLNVRAVIAASQAAIAPLEKSGRGAIINVGSIAGYDGGGPGSGLYASAKAYVHNITRHMARDLAARGIRVNAVAPGLVETAFHAATPPERMAAMRAAIPLGRGAVPDDIAGTFLYLASPMLSAYVTGQIVNVNGGQLMP